MRRLERAQLATDRQRIMDESESETVSGNDDISQDLEAHYQISKSQKDSVNIYSYVCANHGDPAFNVRLCIRNTLATASQ